MEITELIFGIGGILRERVDGWSQTDGGQSRVYPDHPPLSLSSSSYPRGTVDTIGHNPLFTTFDGKFIGGSQLMDITVYAVNSKELNQLVDKTMDAIQDYWDGTSDGTATGFDAGDPYLPNWDFNQLRNVGPVITEEADEGFTRYNKTYDLTFTYLDTSDIEPASVGETEIGGITDIDTFREVPNTETKYVSTGDGAPHITTHQPDNERVIISGVLSESIHTEGDTVKEQREAIDALTETDPFDNRWTFDEFDGWLGVTMVQFFKDRTGIQEYQIDAIYLKKSDYKDWEQSGEFPTLTATATLSGTETTS